MYCHQNTEQTPDIKKTNKSVEMWQRSNIKQWQEQIRMVVHEEITSRLTLGNDCYHSLSESTFKHLLYKKHKF
jgi:hypothetical protein